MSQNIDRDRYTMRKPCPKCDGIIGRLVERNGQDTVRCLGCGEFCYCAPRTETGRAERTHATVHKGVKPQLRARILERDGLRCQWCKADDKPLHVGHIISVDAGLIFGLSDDDINDEENLVAQCEACNLGLGAEPMPLRVAIVLLRARISWRKREAK